jgi:hypothetical protein
MQLKTKLLMPLLVILLMGMTTSAFAQLTCSVSSTPVSRATETGHTEPAGDLTFTCAQGPAATTDATLTVDYLAPITNSEDYPAPGAAGGGISITNQTNCFAGAVVEVDDVNNESGQIVFTVDAVPGSAVDPDPTCSFTITNVLVSLVAVDTSNLRATVSVSPGDNISIIANQDTATVITSIRPGLGDIEVDEGPARFLSTGDPLVPGDSEDFLLTVDEGYIDSFRSQDQAPVGAFNPVMLRFDFTGIPDGAEITCSARISGGDYNGDGDVDDADDGLGPDVLLGFDQTDWPDDFGDEATVDADDSTIFAGFDGDVDLTNVETVTLDCGDDSPGFDPGDADVPMTGEVNVRVTLAPTGDALDDDDVLDDEDDGGEIPRYEEELSDEFLVLAFSPATTTMLVPLAMGNPAVPQPFGSYDTGIAIANTTTDPFGDDGATPLNGPLTFYFFPTTGDPFTVTPAQMAGTCGLNGGGVLVSGRTFVCNTSEILREGGRTAAFTGYMFIVADFTHAHGTAFIYGGTPQERFTSATDVLVIDPPAVQQRAIIPEPTLH